MSYHHLFELACSNNEISQFDKIARDLAQTSQSEHRAVIMAALFELLQVQRTLEYGKDDPEEFFSLRKRAEELQSIIIARQIAQGDSSNIIEIAKERSNKIQRGSMSSARQGAVYGGLTDIYRV